MLHARPSRLIRWRRHPALRLVLDVAAGIHAGNGIRHGRDPRPGSAARADQLGGTSCSSRLAVSNRTLTR